MTLTTVLYFIIITFATAVKLGGCQPTEYTGTNCMNDQNGNPSNRNCGFNNRYGGPSNAEIFDTLTRIENKLGCGAKSTLFSCKNPDEIQDCEDVHNFGITKSGKYEICFLGRVISIYCDFDTPNGPYMVFQRRVDGSLNFFRAYAAYEVGFGDPNREFWAGLDVLHKYTSIGKYSLRVDLENFEREKRSASYERFRVDSPQTNYTLRLGGFSGNAGDALRYHNDMQFSTYDRPNDLKHYCPLSFLGAWWYNNCHHSNLNGLYLGGRNDQFAKGVVWFEWLNNLYSLRKTEMKIKRV